VNYLSRSHEMAENSALPTSWSYATLGDVCLDPQYGWTTSASTGGDLPLVRTTDISSGSIKWQHVPYCDIVPPNVNRYLLNDGDILISRAGSVGKSFLIRKPKRSVFASYLIRFRPLIDERYVNYFLHTNFYWAQISESTSGIAIPNVNANKLRRVELPVAPIAEQRRIADKIDELFSELDAGVASLKRARALLKKYRQAVLKSAVTGELTRDWRERRRGQIEESGADLLQRILKARREAWEAAELNKLRVNGTRPKDDRWKQKYKEPQPPDTTDLPNLPEGWVWATVHQLCEATRPISYGVLQPGADVSNEVPLVRVGDLADGHIAVGALKRISSDIADEYRRTTLRGGEVLLTVVGSIGRTAVVPPSLAGASIARAVAMLPVSRLIRSSWVEFWLRFEPNRQRLETSAHEVARKTLNLEDVRDFAMPIPSIVEQDRIIEEIEDLESVRDASEGSTNTIARLASSLRQSILKAAFTGRLVPQDPNDEPASVLLGRIRAERAASPRPARGRRRKTAGPGGQLELPVR
jgi:type I restriction enzyme, S subunit